jgi:hypothetical protein
MQARRRKDQVFTLRTVKVIGMAEPGIWAVAVQPVNSVRKIEDRHPINNLIKFCIWRHCRSALGTPLFEIALFINVFLIFAKKAVEPHLLTSVKAVLILYFFAFLVNGNV